MDIVLYCFRKSYQKYMNNITSKKEKANIEIIKNYDTIKLPWVTKLEPNLREEFKKFGIKTIFTSGLNLKNLICTNKSNCFLKPFLMFIN